FMQKVEGTSEPAVAGRRGQLYIGGNDGMLHAFDTKTGEEKFAFIPTAVFPKLNKLTGKNYSHEFYVDGTPVVADVYDGTKWRTILVGTLRAGGKGLFALDITNPDDIQLLWELDESSEAVKKLAVKPGYSFPQPTVARMHNGEWAVVTGNGYKSTGANNGAAALYIINAITGKMIKSLEVQSPIKNGGENGLSSPRLADYDSDGIADYAYAGDLHGNLWRFDLLGTGASAPTVTPPSNGNYGAKSGGTDGFVVSNAGSPMFTATSTVGAKRQSITSAPNLVRHPTRKGYLVMFGTGKYFEIGDKTGEESFAQTLYGIWDMNTKAETATAEIITRGELAVQTITSETTGTGKESGKVREARIISNNPVQWYKDNDSSKEVVNRGWRLDLTAAGFTGEMIVENMRTLGSMLLLQTLVPNDDPCANGSTTWLYAINPATGGTTLHHAFDTRTADQGIVSGIKFGSEGGASISQSEKGFTANAPGDTEAISPPADSMGRQTWRMVPDA
ncbi:MAG TPA: PilC/PilY family type IV pilus protein, partial [Pseudomonadales bacterium]|nr:PilC/PilY family type IV pilus protein [Pseudomonadales bacterium]